MALAAYNALGCSGFSRADLILGETGPQILEVNAIPGLTETSLLPQAAEAAGSSSMNSSRGSWNWLSRRPAVRCLVGQLRIGQRSDALAIQVAQRN